MEAAGSTGGWFLVNEKVQAIHGSVQEETEHRPVTSREKFDEDKGL